MARIFHDAGRAASWTSNRKGHALADHEEPVDEIRRIFAEKFAIQVDSADADLLDTGLVDSLTLVDLLVELEQRFGVSLPLEELEIDDLRSVARITGLVRRRRAGAAVTASPPES